jgi:tetratricopeptide (TPR) repeat protein
MQRWIFLFGTLVVLLGCDPRVDYFVGDSSDSRAQELFALVERETDPAARAVAIERLAGHLLADAGPSTLTAYLTTFVEKHPDDPYGAYYLFLAGQNHLDQGSPSFARYYFERVVHDYRDLDLHGRSLHLQALQHLVRLTPSPAKRVGFYQQLLSDYERDVDVGLMHYRLAETYEELGEWDQSYESYREFLRYPQSTVPGHPNAHRDIAARIAFYDSQKDWTVATLEDLRRGITWALVNKNERALVQYQARVNFFTRSWEQDFEDPNVSGFWDIGEILRLTRRLTIDPEAELFEDGDEAFLRTFGWGALRIRTWYLYFRKVDFPADPEIHGNWEWAGVYLGERF